MGIKIVGYTESAKENGFYRLQKLNIDQLFRHVYVSNSQFEWSNRLVTPNKIQVVQGKKPNPELIKQICEQESALGSETIYIGDSMTKDIYMAKMAGVISVLYAYPCDKQTANELYSKLVAISHWTEADFQREQEIKQICKDNNIQPDYSIDSFEHLIEIIQTLNNVNV